MKSKTQLKICLVILVTISCSARKGSNQSNNSDILIPSVYNYNPPELVTKDTSGLKFLMYKPVFVGNVKNMNESFMQGFLTSMEQDFLELFVSRGYQYKGPFDNYNPPVYSDYKYGELIIEPKVAIQIQLPATKKKIYYNPMTTLYSSKIHVDGNASITGVVNITISTTNGGITLWKKNLDVEPRTYMIKSKKYSEYIPLNDPGIWNPSVTNLQVIYQDILSKLWKYLEPEVMQELKKQSNEINNKK